jgi:hypothetical protein
MCDVIMLTFQLLPGSYCGQQITQNEILEPSGVVGGLLQFHLVIVRGHFLLP